MSKTLLGTRDLLVGEDGSVTLAGRGRPRDADDIAKLRWLLHDGTIAVHVEWSDGTDTLGLVAEPEGATMTTCTDLALAEARRLRERELARAKRRAARGGR